MFLAFSNFTTNVKAVVSQVNVEAAAKVMQNMMVSVIGHFKTILHPIKLEKFLLVVVSL